MSERKPLRIELGMHGKNSRVWIDDVEISNYLCNVKVEADVNNITRATLEYIGAVVIEGEVGEVALQQHPIFVECKTCHTTIQGQRKEVVIVDRTGMNQRDREREIVQQEDGTPLVVGQA